jgi:hypothetical protein
MTAGFAWLRTLALALALAGCGRDSGSRAADAQRSAELRDAELLGREILDLVDRAVAYRASHQGLPANSLRQMGLESLTTRTVRRVETVGRDPVITVAFRKTTDREILSCQGTSQTLEDASLNGRYTLMCVTSSGTQRQIEVGSSLEP